MCRPTSNLPLQKKPFKTHTKDKLSSSPNFSSASIHFLNINVNLWDKQFSEIARSKIFLKKSFLKNIKKTTNTHNNILKYSLCLNNSSRNN